ncbi:MAG: transcriptional regulator GcvA [Rhizobiales bacterium]|nr:transcriptional regulator GcvA [Hyphomicrobiales bacterium]
MRDRLPPLNALRAFEATARHMSFSLAAAELFVTPSALSYQVRQLEDHLGQKLFARLNRSIALTDAGARLYPGIHAGLLAMTEAVASLRGATPDNVLVVSTGPAFAAKWLAPRMYRFIEDNPEIEFQLAASLKLVDLATDEADLAIRYGYGDYPDLHVEPIFNDTVKPMCAPELIARGLKTPGDLKNFTLLHDDSIKHISNAPGWPEWLRRANVRDVDGTRGVRFNYADHCIDAAVEGAGVALGRTSLAGRELKSQRLVAPFDIDLATSASFWFVCHPRALEKLKVQRFRDWIFREAALT